MDATEKPLTGDTTQQPLKPYLNLPSPQRCHISDPKSNVLVDFWCLEGQLQSRTWPPLPLT